MGQIQTIDELIGLLIRRRLLIGAVAVFGIVFTFLYVIAKPDIFESTAVIQVQSPSPAETAAGTGQSAGKSAQRLQAIEQRLTTRENMLSMIQRHNLYTDLPITVDEKVSLLRKSVQFEPVASAASAPFAAAPEVSALLITTRADSREIAARLANDFAQSILDASAEGQITRAREAASFFHVEEARLMDAVSRLNTEVSTFKAENNDALPTQRDRYRDQIGGLDAAIRDIDQSLVAAISERTAIEKKRTLRATDERQLVVLASDIETLSDQRALLSQQRDVIVAALSRMPEVEQVLSEYELRMAQLQSQLAAASQRRAEADTTQKLEDMQQGENFTLLERAVEPENPISTQRRKLAIAGTLASLVLGLAAAFAMDTIFPVLRTRSQLERQLDLRPIVSIPEIAFSPAPARSRGGLWKLKPGIFTRQIPWFQGSDATTPEGMKTARGVAGLTPFQMVLGGGAIVLLLVAAALMT